MVVASGPSLTQEVADQCRSVRCLCVSDAYKLLPWADALYSADSKWWEVHNGCAEFLGEKWIPHSGGKSQKVADRFGLTLVDGEWRGGFSRDPKRIHFGSRGTGNSGFQAVNLVILLGATRIILVGFDMREVEGRKHFFGNHPKALIPNQNFNGWIHGFTDASKNLPDHISIVNATPGSALQCFPAMSLSEALECRRAA